MFSFATKRRDIVLRRFDAEKSTPHRQNWTPCAANNLMRGCPGQMSRGPSRNGLIYAHDNQIRLRVGSNLHNRVRCEVEGDQAFRIEWQIRLGWDQLLEPFDVARLGCFLLFDEIRDPGTSRARPRPRVPG